jgi:hypothetical protein
MKAQTVPDARGLDPAIHALNLHDKNVDARVKPGHDDVWDRRQSLIHP